MADEDFLYFNPEDDWGFYQTVRAAVQFLTDNYWKNIGDSETIALIGLRANVEENFHTALVNALSGTKQAIAKWPQDGELPKLTPIFEHVIPSIGGTENYLISMVHGQEISALQRRLGDERSNQLYEQMVAILDSHLETHSSLLVAELVTLLERYLEHIRGLAAAYEHEEESPVAHASKRNQQTYSTLLDRLEEKIEALWLIGVMENADWA